MAQAQNGVTLGSGTFQGQSAISVSAISGSSAQLDKNGNPISFTITTTTAYFGTGKNEGQFLGATSTSTTNFVGSDAQTISTTGLNFGQATRIMGADRMSLGPELAAGDAITHFPSTVAADARAHPLKYVGIAAEAGLMATPVPEAYEGAKAIGDVVLAGAHLLWDLAH